MRFAINELHEDYGTNDTTRVFSCRRGTANVGTRAAGERKGTRETLVVVALPKLLYFSHISGCKHGICIGLSLFLSARALKV